MFRIIKRSPWIALGAAGAWFLDPEQGAQRRAAVTSKVAQWKRDLTSSRPASAPFEAPPMPGSSGVVDPTFAQRSA
jgi:hypothetical protein